MPPPKVSPLSLKRFHPTLKEPRMTSLSLWNQRVAPMYTRPPKRKMQPVAEEPTGVITIWCAEAKDNADWEAMAWITKQHWRT